jgi:hypothetical protein
MRKLVSASVLVAVCLSMAALARADDVTLNVSGSLAVANPPGTCSVAGCTLGGDIVINNATGTVISQDVTMSGESPSVGPFTTFVNLQSIVGETRLALVDSSANWIEFFFATPTPGSLVGYDGGALDTITGVGFPPPTAPTWLLTSGAFTPVTTPESNSVVLLLAGFGFVFVMQKCTVHRRGHLQAALTAGWPSPR